MIDQERVDHQAGRVIGSFDSSELTKLRFENHALEAQVETLKRLLESSMTAYDRLAIEYRALLLTN